jgi:hypothetical protein
MKTSGIKKSVTETGSGIWGAMPLWAKGLVIGGGIFIAYKITKNLLGNTRLNEGTRDSKQEEDGWNQEFVRDAISAKPTLTNTQLKSYANTIHTAMDGYGTDEYAIVGVLKNIKNNADFSGLNAAWGRREISSGTFNPEPNLKNATLAEAMTHELSRYWIDMVNKGLSKNGVKYKF